MTNKRFTLEFSPNKKYKYINDMRMELSDRHGQMMGFRIEEDHEENVDILINFLNILHEVNQSLIKENEELKSNCKNYEWYKEYKRLLNENEQLKERNNRQAKQLDNLYTLIEKQDWKTLKEIIQEFQECEEQLQRESGTYGDVK